MLIPPFTTFNPGDILPGINNRVIDLGEITKDLQLLPCDTPVMYRKRGKQGNTVGFLDKDAVDDDSDGKGKRIRIEAKDVKAYRITKDFNKVYALLMQNVGYRAQFEGLVRRNLGCRVWFVTGVLTGRVRRRGVVDEGGEVIWDGEGEGEKEEGEDEEDEEKEEKRFPEVILSVDYKEVKLCAI